MSKPNALAIALEISKRRKKKMAKGGPVNESAASEHRPMPSEKDKDASMVSHNGAKKPIIEGQWDSRPDIKQSQKGLKTTPIKHPKMVPSSTFTSRLRDEEDDLQESASVNNGPQIQPPEHDDELEAKKHGPSVPALHMKRMAEGGQVAPINEDKARDFKKGFESGGPSMGEMIDNIKDVFKADGGMIEDEEPQPLIKLSRGGEVSPEHEIMEDHDASIASAIMAKRRMMADGGMVDIDENAEEQPNQYYRRNEEVLKENYDSDMDDVSQPMDSNEHSVDIDSDDHDMVSAIRRKIMAKRKA